MSNRGRLRRIAALAVVLLPVALSAGACAQEPGDSLRLTFLDVGQGDATLLQSPDGKTALVDAGRGEELTGRLKALGVETIDLLVASHADADHIGGMLDVIRRMPVRYFLDNGIPHDTQTYLSLIREVHARPDITYLTAAPRTIALGDAAIQVLPLPSGIGGTEDQNDESVGLVVRYGDFRVFLSGDSEREELSWWLTHDDVPRITVLKAPHHGSDNGYTPAFLDAARPQVVVVSVGRNSYGHPMPEALAAYRSIARRVYRTDRDGDVTILGYRDGHFEVTTGSDSAGVVLRNHGDTATPYDAEGRVAGRYAYD